MMIPLEERSTVLAVAGLDPSGGAGLSMDTAVIRSLGLHPLSVLTGVAVQNTSRFDARIDFSPDAIIRQLDVLVEEFPVGAVKIGMIGDTKIVEALAIWLAERPRLPVVLDPVLASTSGGALGGGDVPRALLRHLVPRATVVTPNLEEAAVFLGREFTRKEEMPAAARALRDRGAAWCLIKGGHLDHGSAVDFLGGADTELWLEEDRVGGSVRGTGCALASALAGGLARGETVPEAARTAKALVTRAVRASYAAGDGRFLGIDVGS